jgi:NAD(P)-dependent dehydrogenase (short-subunit alcohol dehydrogenase family)
MDKAAETISLVTGASRGLGAALAETLAAKGHHVIAIAQTVGALEELDDRIQAAGGAATLVPVDISNEDAIKQICRSIHERWGRVDLWCHAAIHAAPLCPVSHMDAKDYAKTQKINVEATLRLIANFEPLLKASADGKAVFFDDPLKDAKFHATYGQSKASQIQMARIWAQETETLGPKVQIVTPAPMPTATRARFYPGEDRTKLTDCRSEATRLLGEIL